MTASTPNPASRARKVNPPLEHPSWCDPVLCTADPTAKGMDGYRAGAGGEHRSAPLPVDLRTAMWLPSRTGTVYLTEAAPWMCSAYLQLHAGDAKVSMTVEHAGPILDALAALVATARAAEGTIS